MERKGALSVYEKKNIIERKKERKKERISRSVLQ